MSAFIFDMHFGVLSFFFLFGALSIKMCCLSIIVYGIKAIKIFKFKLLTQEIKGPPLVRSLNYYKIMFMIEIQ